MHRLFATVCGVVALLWAQNEGVAAGFDYWVWHRTQPLAERERQELVAQGVQTLYWHAGEMVQQPRGGTWRWKNPPRPVAGWAGSECRVVPVVRLTSDSRKPFAPEALAGLIPELKSVAGDAGAVQLDFDCPDRLLPDYAAALRSLRTTIPHLSITALAGWPRVAGFKELTSAVEEIAPMFYDLQADPTGVSADAPPPPLLDPEQIATVILPWKNCPIPWRAGLPSFARLTVFDRTGLFRGQIPNWSWEDVCFQSNLRTLAPTRLGVSLFRVAKETKVAATPVTEDEIVVSRFADRPALAKAVRLAREAGAQGVILFRLPDDTGPGGGSLESLGQLESDQRPSLILRTSGEDRLELVNDSPVDLGPRLSGERNDRDRGYALEIDAPAPVFREAGAGDFWRVTSHTRPESDQPRPAPVTLATRLTLWFGDLPAHGTRQTGLFQLAASASVAQLRYRILHVEGASEWRPISASPLSTAP